MSPTPCTCQNGVCHGATSQTLQVCACLPGWSNRGDFLLEDQAACFVNVDAVTGLWAAAFALVLLVLAFEVHYSLTRLAVRRSSAVVRLRMGYMGGLRVGYMCDLFGLAVLCGLRMTYPTTILIGENVGITSLYVFVEAFVLGLTMRLYYLYFQLFLKIVPNAPSLSLVRRCLGVITTCIFVLFATAFSVAWGALATREFTFGFSASCSLLGVAFVLLGGLDAAVIAHSAPLLAGLDPSIKAAAAVKKALLYIRFGRVNDVVLILFGLSMILMVCALDVPAQKRVAVYFVPLLHLWIPLGIFGTLRALPTAVAAGTTAPSPPGEDSLLATRSSVAMRMALASSSAHLHDRDQYVVPFNSAATGSSAVDL